MTQIAWLFFVATMGALVVVYIKLFLKLVTLNAKIRELQRELLWLKRKHGFFEGMPYNYASETLDRSWNKI